MRFYRELPRQLRLELSAMVFFAGIVLTVFTVDRYAFGGSSGSSLPDFLKDIDRRIGPWIIWVAFVGILLLLGGGWYFVDTIRKRREFQRLLNTDSKAKFVRNQLRMERLAWNYLGSDYFKRLEKKKGDLGLK